MNEDLLEFLHKIAEETATGTVITTEPIALPQSARARKKRDGFTEAERLRIRALLGPGWRIIRRDRRNGEFRRSICTQLHPSFLEGTSLND